MLEILCGLQSCWDRKERAVLATIIEVNGAAYRREGARCLILESGKIIGAVSGGCVEGDILEHARAVLDSDVPKEIHYDLSSEGDLLWGLGTGCSGTLSIWLQEFNPVRRPEQAKQLMWTFEKRAACVTPYTAGLVLESKYPSKISIGTYLDLDLSQAELNGTVITTGRIIHVTLQGVKVKLFAETVQPRPRLIIFGAGSGAVPLVREAKHLQWHVTVVDHRSQTLNQVHIREADEHFVPTRDQYLEIPVADDAYVVVMTHNYELDRMLIKALLFGNIAYLGVLGSRNRIERILEDIRFEVGELSEEVLEKLHSPIGLDIGAESPEEIALSILSELVGRKYKGTGVSLRTRKGPIHQRRTANSLTLVNL